MCARKEPSLIDVPVLMIFFARPRQFEIVFQEVKRARPSKLFLYQDGPRPDRPDDIKNIEKCREIVEHVDWECEIHKLYQEKNFGCDPSMFIAIKWIFDHVERAVILEDDVVPSLSFFPFCKDLLEKYYDDERINMICGMNHLGELKDLPHSYIFTKNASIWGWATWKRTVDLWEEHLDFLKDNYSIELLRQMMGKNDFKLLYSTCKKHRATGIAHFESILGASEFLNNRLNIVPAKNMISNIGIGDDTTHSVNSMNKMPKGLRRVFFMKTFEMEFPLKHPKYVIEDVGFKKKIFRIMSVGHPLVSFYRRCEFLFYMLIAGDYSSLKKGLKRRLMS